MTLCLGLATRSVRLTMPPYSTRNLRYLRLSKNQAIQLLLNLKQEHLEWFNDRIFQVPIPSFPCTILRDSFSHPVLPPQHILAALQPLLCNALELFLSVGSFGSPPPPLRDALTQSFIIHTIADFQFAYYLKPTDNQHHILVKNKNYIFPEKPTTASAAGPSKPSKSGKPTSDDDYFDDDLNEAEEPEEKPTLHVTYSGFTIHPKTLMVVAEPYDPSRPSRAPQYHGFEYEGDEDEMVGGERAVDAGVGSSRRDADTGG
ncbi:hypothetical protein BC936DRAFT_138653 [Jimgerdemannia flammicorona]|uniref:Uncharacterized protein n=1 Tax=Jimgerdemannia flammicorona TaxID=994334 RepID=A0A433BVK0_9FUNG|nr:hypothetical protein BC936DRAFT_138653 [Jimgerdemannia flammicorona]